MQVAEIFSGDIDFHRSLRKEDRFAVVYETLEADGEPLRSGRVLSTEFRNNGKTYEAVWFQEPEASKGAYYTLEGESMRRAYLASPVEFSRVTSGFEMRMHPILKTWRAHLGTDYAAPTGTPVRTVGDGVVEFAGVQNGFGNVVFVKHRNQHVTVYAHLSRIDVKNGQSVEQGQTVGAVGATGWAHGPAPAFRVPRQRSAPGPTNHRPAKRGSSTGLCCSAARLPALGRRHARPTVFSRPDPAGQRPVKVFTPACTQPAGECARRHNHGWLHRTDVWHLAGWGGCCSGGLCRKTPPGTGTPISPFFLTAQKQSCWP